MSSSTPEPRFPHPAAGLVVFLGVTAGLAAMRLLPLHFPFAAVPVLMLAATAAATVAFKVDAKDTLLLRLPSAADFLMAIPLTISVFILEDQISVLLNVFFPLSDAVLDESRRLITARSPGEWVVTIAVVGVGAAAAEELMFRGFMQTAFLQGVGRAPAILLSAALFAALHFPHAAILFPALVLGFVALATRSIVVPMFVHFCNNVAVVLLFNLGGLESLGDPVWLPATILVPAVAMFALSLGYYARRVEPDRTSAETRHAGTGNDPERDRIMLRHDPRPLSDELASIPTRRRRLGWLVVALSMITGVVVLLGLFGWSVYFIHPERVNAQLIALVERHVMTTLTPEAESKAPQIESAFHALGALNDTGQLELEDLASVARTHRQLAADGVVDEDDADALVESIRVMVMRKTSPRAL